MSRYKGFAVNPFKFKFWPQSELLKNSFTLFTGATIGQLIPFVAGPLLSRLYSPADFGFFAMMSTTAGLASVISTGSYEYAIVTAKEEEADDLVMLAATLSLFFSFVSAAILFAIILIAEPWLNNQFGWMWMLVPAFIFLQGLTNIFNYRFNRNSQYREMARGKMMRDFVMTLSQLFFGVLNFRWGLFPGVVFGQASAVGFFIKKSWESLRSAIMQFSFKRMKYACVKFYRFPLYLMPSLLINELSVQVPIYFLNFFFTNSAVGLYALPQKFLNVPVVLIGNSIGQVFFKDAAENLDSPEVLKKNTLGLFRMLFYISVIPFSIIMVFGDSLIYWVFGPNWSQSGIYAQYLSPWLMFVLIGSPISRLFTVLDKQKQSLWFNSMLLSLRICGLAIGVFLFNSADVAVKLFSITGALYWIFLSFYILHMVKVRLMPVIVNTFITWLAVLLVLFSIKYALP